MTLGGWLLFELLRGMSIRVGITCMGLQTVGYGQPRAHLIITYLLALL
jgi:hypothetical protein